MAKEMIHKTTDICAQVFKNRKTNKIVVLFAFTHDTLDKLKAGAVANTASEDGDMFVFAAAATVEEALEILEPLSPGRPQGH